MKYCLEEHYLKSGKFDGAVPMVSFCDIPFSKAETHMKSYGFFGIGLKKEWALKNSLNPVVYIEKDSKLSLMLEPYFVDVVNNDDFGDINNRYQVNDLGNGKHEIILTYTGGRKIRIDAVIALLSFIKNRNGDLKRKGKRTVKNYNFYDEREWRFIPTIQDFQVNHLGYKPFLTPLEFVPYSKRPIKDRFLPGILLPFTSNDIDYLIVKEEKDIPITIRQLKKYNHLFHRKEDAELLFSKLVSSKRLLRDV